MKPFITSISIMLFTLTAITGFAQSKRPSRQAIFTSFPAVIDCTEAELANIFSYTKGKNISVNLGNKLRLTGTVTMNMNKFSNLQTVAIKLPSFNNTMFSLSKRIDENNKTIYIGHLLDPKNADGFELKRTGEGKYQLIKIETEKLLQDCAQQ